jgi:GTP-binding protein EngB required for normal cell division
MRESALQRPHFTQTKSMLAMMRDREMVDLPGSGGKRMARKARKKSAEHIVA